MNQLKLYEVTAKWYILAKDELDARCVPQFFDLESVTTEIHEATSVESDWWKWLPFSTVPNVEDKTCGQILAEMRGEGTET